MIRRTLVLLAAMASPALAQNDLAELQVNAGPFADFMRAAIIQAAGPTCPTQVDSAFCGGQDCYLDRVDIDQAGTLRRIGQTNVTVDPTLPALTTQAIQFVQPMTAHLKTLACIRDPNCPRDKYALDFPLHLLLSLTLSNGQICVTPTGFQEPVPPGLIPNASPICTNLDTGAIGQLTGPAMEVVAQGLTVNDDASVLAVRMEVLPKGFAQAVGPQIMAGINAVRAAAWQEFLDGTLGDAPVGPNDSPSWRLHLTSDLLTQAMELRFRDAVDDDPDATLDGDVTGTWFPVPTAGDLFTQFQAEIDTHVCPNDIGVNMDINMPLKLVPGGFEIHGTAKWDTVDSDVALCGALFGGFVFSPISIPIAASIADSFSPDAGSFVGDTDCTAVVSQTEDNTMNLDCTMPLEMPNIRIGNAFLDFSLDAATPAAGGLTLHGAAHGGGPGQELPASKAKVDGGFGYGAQGDCNSGFHAGYAGDVILWGPELCNAEIIDDPDQVYEIGKIDAGNFTYIDVDFPSFDSTMCQIGPDTWQQCPPGQAPLDDFWQSPYPMTMTLWTQGGAFTVQLDAPKQASAQDQFAATLQSINAIAECKAPQTGLFGIPGLYDPRWAVDPGPIDLPLLQSIRGRQAVIGQVSLRDLAVHAPNGFTDALGALRTDEVRVELDATAVVSTRSGEFKVPVAVPLGTTWLAEGRDGVPTQLTLARDAAASVDLSRQLRMDGVGFQLDLPARSLAVVGR